MSPCWLECGTRRSPPALPLAPCGAPVCAGPVLRFPVAILWKPVASAPPGPEKKSYTRSTVSQVSPTPYKGIPHRDHMGNYVDRTEAPQRSAVTCVTRPFSSHRVTKIPPSQSWRSTNLENSGKCKREKGLSMNLEEWSSTSLGLYHSDFHFRDCYFHFSESRVCVNALL